jgi:hypothetical protein
MGWRVILTGFAGALVLLGVLLYMTPVFEVREDQLEITGNATLAREEVVRLIRVRNGMKLARVRPQAIEDRVERHPLIRKAQVKMRIPSGLRVEIQERRLWAVWTGDRLTFQVSDDGRVLDIGYRSDMGGVIRVDDRRKLDERVPVRIGMEIDELWGYRLAGPLAHAASLSGVDRVFIDERGGITGKIGESGAVRLGKTRDIVGTVRMMGRIPEEMWTRFHSCRTAEYDSYGFVVVAGCDPATRATEATDDQGQAGTHL